MQSDTIFAAQTFSSQKNDNSACHDYFLMLNTNMEIISFNSAIQKLFTNLNCGAKLQKGKAVFGFLSLTNVRKLKQSLAKAAEGQTTSIEMLVNEKSQSKFWIKVTVTPTFNHDDELLGFACMGCNIENERMQQEKIIHQNNMLSKIAQSHSHEVRHPLTNILGIISLIRHDQFQLSEQFIQFLETSAVQLDDVIKKVVFNSYNGANN